MKQYLFFAVLAAACSLGAANLINNPSFETADSKTGFALGWNTAGSVSLETTNVHSGRHAAKLEKSGSGNVNCDQVVRFPKPLTGNVKCTIRYSLCGVNVQGAYVVFYAGTKEKFQRQWVNLGGVKDSFEWKTFEHTLELEHGTAHLAMSFRLNGTGTLFVDDVSVEITEPEAAAMLDFQGPLNPATQLPGQWTEKKYIGNENASAIRIIPLEDGAAAEQQWQSGAAKSGFANANIPEAFFAFPAIRVTTRVKVADRGEAMIGLEFFDAGGNTVTEVLAPPSHAADWEKLTATFRCPPEAKSFQVLMLNTGEGTVWFDTVSITKGDPKDAVNSLKGAFEVQVFPVSTSLDQLGEENTLNMFVDSPVGVAFHFKGEQKKMKNPALVIDVPAALEITDVFTSHPSQWRAEKYSFKPFNRQEGPYKRYRLENTRAMQIAVPGGFAYQRKNIVTIMPEDQSGFNPSEQRIFYHLENNGVADLESAFTIRYLPPMPQTPNPKRFKAMRWDGMDMSFSNDRTLLAAIRQQEEAGFTWARRFERLAPRFEEIEKILTQRNWRFMLGGAPSSNLNHYASIKDQITLEVAINADGKVRGHNEMCPEFITHEPKFAPLRDEVIRANIAARHPQPGDYLILDFEDWQPMEWCFCERCRTAFAAANNLSPVPGAAEIKKQHAEAWRDFRRRNGAEKIKMVADVVRKHFPFLTFGDYTYIVDYSKKDYENYFYSVAKDAALNEKYLDMHLPSYYHIVDAAGFDMMKIGRAKLKKEYVPIIAIDGIGYLSKNNVLGPERVRMMILNAAANGCSGFSVYPGDHIDGKFMLAIDHAMADVASSEAYLLDGKPDSRLSAQALPYRSTQTVIGGQNLTLQFPRWDDYFRYSTHQLGQGTLITLLNHHPDQTAYAEVGTTLPDGRYAVIDRIAGKRLPVDNVRSFLVEVAPRDVRFLEIIPENIAPELPLLPAQNVIRQNFEHERVKFNRTQQESVFAPKKEGVFNFQYSDINQDKRPEIEVSSPGQSIFIDLECGGSLLDWRIGKNSLTELLPGHLVAQSRLHMPVNARQDPAETSACKFIAAGVENQQAFVTIERKFTLISLTERKTFRIDAGNHLRVDYVFTNTGDKEISFSLWNRNAMNPGKSKDATQTSTFLASTSDKLEQLEQKSEIVLPRSVLKSGKSAAILAGGKYRIEAEIPFGDLKQLYFWLSPGICTWEWMLRDVTLAPGKSFQSNILYTAVAN